MYYGITLSFIADDASSENEAMALFIAYSSTDEKSTSLLHHMAALKANMSTFHETSGGAIATLSVYFFSSS